MPVIINEFDLSPAGAGGGPDEAGPTGAAGQTGADAGAAAAPKAPSAPVQDVERIVRRQHDRRLRVSTY